MAAYEQELGVRKKEVHKLNIAPLSDGISNIESYNMENSGVSGQISQTFKGQEHSD